MKKKYLQPVTGIVDLELEQIIAASVKYIEVDDKVWGNPEDAASREMSIETIFD